ncbi:DUF5723 family protein [Jiulongibacter sp. NS-SX5]|uniref:DUF5723 family protein n=1 Tax=Jiulongibacter sp. NS-SX5 TaxID=3463854 RepID=UPI00405966C8
MKQLNAFLLLLLLCFSKNLHSQSFLGVAQSNYAGSHAVLLNPAHAVDSRFKIHLNLGIVGAEVQNNFLKWGAPFSLFRLITKTVPGQYLSPTSGLPVWRPQYYEESNANRAKLFVNSEIRGPALTLNFPRIGFGLSGGVRYRIFGSLSNSSPNILQTIATGTRNPLLQNIDYVGTSGLMNISGINEFYGSIAKVLREDDIEFLKVGASAKMLTSNLNLSVDAQSVDYRIEPNPPANQSETVYVGGAQGIFFHAAPNSGAPGLSWLLEQMTSFSAIGKGYAVDIGAVYEWRPNHARERYRYEGKSIPDPELNKYKLRLGASLTDIGFISYNSASEVQVGTVNNGGTVIPPATFYQLSSTREFVADVEQVFNPNMPYGTSFRILMPAKLNLQADYKVREEFYVGAILRQSLFGKGRMGPIGYSSLSVIPRFEKRHVEFSFPISLNQDYTNLNLGATMRAGPLWLGMDSMTGWFGIGKPKSMSVHAGLFLALRHRRPKNNELDCPDINSFQPSRKVKRKARKGM